MLILPPHATLIKLLLLLLLLLLCELQSVDSLARGALAAAHHSLDQFRCHCLLLTIHHRSSPPSRRLFLCA
jgi:hypothetical protein